MEDKHNLVNNEYKKCILIQEYNLNNYNLTPLVNTKNIIFKISTTSSYHDPNVQVLCKFNTYLTSL